MHIIGTDGSYRSSKEKASWATVYGDSRYVRLVENFIVSGITPTLEVLYEKTQPKKATGNRGELLAILVALQIIENEIPPGEDVVIVSDSEYSINTITKWYYNWVTQGTIGKKLNLDIIDLIMQKMEQLKDRVEFYKIAAHVKPKDFQHLPDKEYYEINFIADELARAETEKQ